MKKQLLLVMIVLFAFGIISYGDVIINDRHHVQKCVKITNLDDYPDVALLGFVPPGTVHYDTYLITSAECLTKGYKYNDFNVYAVSKTYLEGKDIKKIDLPRDPNAVPNNIHIELFGGYLPDSIPISGIDQYFKILGFSKTEVILHKWKEVTRFNNGKPDSTTTYVYAEPVIQLYQKIQTGIDVKEIRPSFKLFPNPANKAFHLKINNMYQGIVPVQIVGPDGRVVRLSNLEKYGYTLDREMNVENLPRGTYTVCLKFGKVVENQKIVIR